MGRGDVRKEVEICWLWGRISACWLDLATRSVRYFLPGLLNKLAISIGGWDNIPREIENCFQFRQNLTETTSVSVLQCVSFLT